MDTARGIDALRPMVGRLIALLVLLLALVAACASSPALTPTAAPVAEATQPASPTLVPPSPTMAPTVAVTPSPAPSATSAPVTPSPAPTKAAPSPTSQATSSADVAKAGLGDYVFFPEVAIRLRQPNGFTVADSFSGFAQTKSGASVLAIRMAAPYAETTAGLTAEQMKPRGLTLLSRQDITVDGIPGILINFEQTAAGIEFLKWGIAFGDSQSVIMITATLPKEAAAELSPMLKACVLSTTVDRTITPNPGALLNFTIVASPKMKPMPGISGTLGFTKDGLTTSSPKDPLFVVARSLGNVTVTNRRQFAEQRLSQTATAKLDSITSTKAITVDGLEGYESLAKATDTKSGTKLVVYQVVLFDSSAYYLMQGLVGDELSGEYQPEFAAMARSFKRK